MVKCIHYTSCLNLSSVGKTSEETYAANLGISFLNICDYFKIYFKSTEIQLHISSVR